MVTNKLSGPVLLFERTAVIKEKNMAEARCMKCKKQVEVKDPKEVVMKNGMKAVSGVCPECGTKVFKILGKK
jgi:DNA-directed RNA polymerase subunit RPC12/RpoP